MHTCTFTWWLSCETVCVSAGFVSLIVFSVIFAFYDLPVIYQMVIKPFFLCSFFLVSLHMFFHLSLSQLHTEYPFFVFCFPLILINFTLASFSSFSFFSVNLTRDPAPHDSKFTCLKEVDTDFARCEDNLIV